MTPYIRLWFMLVCAAFEPDMAFTNLRVSACQFEIKGGRQVGAQWNNTSKDFSRVQSLFENVSHGTVYCYSKWRTPCSKASYRAYWIRQGTETTDPSSKHNSVLSTPSAGHTSVTGAWWLHQSLQKESTLTNRGTNQADTRCLMGAMVTRATRKLPLFAQRNLSLDYTFA